MGEWPSKNARKGHKGKHKGGGASGRGGCFTTMIMLVIAAAGLALLAGCDPDAAPRTSRASKAPAAPNPGAQVPAPAADPMACNPGQQCNEYEYVKLRIAWLGERSGKVTLHINGVAGAPIQAMKPDRLYGSYTGLWERTVSLDGIRTIGLEWAPDGPRMPVQCMIFHKGQPVDFMTSDNGGPCAVNWTVAW